MIVYKNLKEKRWGKQRKYEHTVLRDIHLKDIRKSARNILIHPNIFFHTEFELLERIVLDHAIEAYLYGASFGKWGYLGEDFLTIQKRMNGKDKFFVQTCFSDLSDRQVNLDSKKLYACVEDFILKWIRLGFQNGTRKYKLRLIR